MKKIKFFLLLFASIGLLFSCSENELTTPVDSVTNEQVPQWNDLIQQLDFETNIVFVENDGSIQEAINAAEPKTKIYIEPGEYYEKLTLTKSDVKLISTGLLTSDKVVIENPNEVIINKLNSAQLKKAHKPVMMNREDLGNGIAHYTFDVTIGLGTYDVLRLHRVVKEKKAYKPYHSKGNVFMVHGAIQDFDDIFLRNGAEVINDQTSAPYYLALKGIDVWGIDLAWNLVPPEESDFEFMKDWGVEKDMHYVLKAMSIARLIRGLTTQGCDKMNLLGFSYGVAVAYGAAGYETQLHPLLRHINGLIPVDTHFKYKPGSDADNSTCAQADEVLANINDGQYQNMDAFQFIYFSGLALTAPDEPAVYNPALTNMQFLMGILSAHDGYHFYGGTHLELYYTDSMRVARVGLNVGPYMPNRAMYEQFACGCSSKEVGFDDYISDIKLPVFFMTAQGGEGAYDDYTRTLIQSKDYTCYNVDDPERETEFDFGHGDIWAADMASEWVWEPLYQWLLEH